LGKVTGTQWVGGSDSHRADLDLVHERNALPLLGMSVHISE